MGHPYENLEPTAFWRTAVAERPPEKLAGLWSPKFPFGKTDRIATFGSCFAQHISAALVAQNYNWFDAERADSASEATSRERGYGIFSARTGNIYTAAALRQWIEWATGRNAPPSELWEKNGRYFDPFRPTIEPFGFASPAELLASREITFHALRDVIERADHFVFTLGLTEAWVHRDGYTYAACPGTGPAGVFDPAQHSFKNFSYPEIANDMMAVLAILQQMNKRIRILLTVSPIPLTATASGKHVLVATTQSKSVLRAVAAHLSDSDPRVDYFPSYEIITGAPFRARFYEPNLRSVTSEGVAFVMRHFFEGLTDELPASSSVEPPRRGSPVHASRQTQISAKPRGQKASAWSVASNSFASVRRVFEDLKGKLTASHGIEPAPRGSPVRARGKEQDSAKSPRRRAADIVCEEIMLDAFAPSTVKTSKLPPNAGQKKICIVGNSHIDALRQAIRHDTFSDSRMDIVFWGFAGHSYNEIKIENGRLSHPNKAAALAVSKGRFESIDPTEFDALVFVSAGFQFSNTLTRFHRRPKHLENHLKQMFVKRDAIALMKSAARIAPSKTYFVPSPLISESSGEGTEVNMSEAAFEDFTRTITDVFAKNGVIYIPQPPETIRANKWTKAEYCVERDPRHMNRSYGALILAEIRNRLGIAAEPIAAPREMAEDSRM